METGKRRSRVLLKAVQGGSNHRRLELSEESEMSDCSCSSESETVDKHSHHSHTHAKTRGCSQPQTQSPTEEGPVIPPFMSLPFNERVSEQKDLKSSFPAVGSPDLTLPHPLAVGSPDQPSPHTLKPPKHTNPAHTIDPSDHTPVVPHPLNQHDLPDHTPLDSPVPHSLRQHDPSDLPRPLKQYISSESLPSAHAHHSPSRQPRLHSSSKSLHSVSDAAPRPPANTLSSTKPHPLGWPSSQSHPDPNIISPAPLMSPCLLTQLSTKSAPTSPSDSRHSLCISEPEGAVVCDIATNMPSCAVSSKTAAGRDVNSQAKVEKRNEVTVRSKGVRRSLSQPTLTVPSIALPAKSRGKRHIFVSPMLSVMNGSTDSLPTLKYSVVQPCDREPPSPKPARLSKHHSKASKRQVHPEERTASKFSEDHIRLFQSPSSSESSTARRKPSLTESARSSAVSLTLGPLLTAGLRIGKTKSMAEGRWENAEEAQLESCFPDRHIRLSVVTWNMNERKVSE